mmetsp:Transcript_48599/g.80589  ORF Transcript_48599/g.80589 Transcript_48599/m.80589 type:complete len:303 (-) Transcript_48599:183-1091(-)
MATDSKKRRLPETEEATELTSGPSPSKKRKVEATQESKKKKAIENNANTTSSAAKVAKDGAGLNVPDLPLVLIFLTGNKGKLREVQAYLGDDIGKYVINYKVDLDEIQGSEEEILSHKLYGAQQHLKKLENSSCEQLKDKEVYILVEDTSLYLGQYSKKFNFPGPFCKWALKANGNQSYIDMVANHEDRSCTAMCIFGLLRVKLNDEGECDGGEEEEEDDDVQNEYKPRFFKGDCKGTVTDKPRGDDGFGWDPIFEFIGNKKTFAEMNTEEKNKISHRANALKNLKQHLENDLLANIKDKKQ